MTKPWEETWEWDAETNEVYVSYPGTPAYLMAGLVGRPERIIVETDNGCYPPRDGEWQLIVAAPEMVRLLLDLEWAGHDVLYRCPACEMSKAKGHDADCRLVAVLRKIGALPEDENG